MEDSVCDLLPGGVVPGDGSAGVQSPGAAPREVDTDRVPHSLVDTRLCTTQSGSGLILLFPAPPLCMLD